MRRPRLLTMSEQVAEHLREELLRGRWSESMPGRDRLVAELGVGRDTVGEALRILEREGLLTHQGKRRKRRINIPKGRSKLPKLRVRILLYERRDRALIDNARLLGMLQEAGFDADYAPQAQKDLGMNPERVARFVRRHPADAWVIQAGSREIIEWFAARSVPAIAVFGRFLDLPIAAASPRKIPALRMAVKRLVGLGHRRIVMLTREERRRPEPARFEQAFLDELKSSGVATGRYNLPDWKESPAGLHACLARLFRHTPPTALLIEESDLFLAVRQHLADRGIVAPADISLVCGDPDSSFVWCDPAVSHIRWDHAPVIRRVVRWARNVAGGRDDRRQFFANAEFIEGGTIAAAACAGRRQETSLGGGKRR